MNILKKEALKGLIAKNLHKNPVYVERLKSELRTIEKLGFASYFLTVADIVKNQREIQAVGTVPRFRRGQYSIIRS